MNTNEPTRLTKWIASFAALAALAGNNLLHAQSWETVLDYQFIGNGSSYGGCIAANSFGEIFVGGVGYPATGFGSGLVLKTDTAAANWSLSDRTNPTPPQTGLSVSGLAFDAAGNLYSAGTLYNQCTKTSCPGTFGYVRKSADHGANWVTAELVQPVAGKSAWLASATGDALGNIFVCGMWTDANDVSHWLVRRSGDGGLNWESVDDLSWGRCDAISFVPGVGIFAVGNFTTTTVGKGNKVTTTQSWVVRRSLSGEPGTWTTVDVVQPAAGQAAWPFAVSSDAYGNVFVAGRTTVLIGSGRTNSKAWQWLVRQSSNRGQSNTWSTTDAFSFVAGKNAMAEGLGRGPDGNIVASGWGADAQGSIHWLVRTPTGQGSWQIIDDYQLAPGQWASAREAFTTSAGDLVVVGSADDTAGIGHWIVRRLTGP